MSELKQDLETSKPTDDCYGQPTCSFGGINRNCGTSIVYHDKHCRINNDAPILPQYEKAYCTCSKRNEVDVK